MKRIIISKNIEQMFTDSENAEGISFTVKDAELDNYLYLVDWLGLEILIKQANVE